MPIILAIEPDRRQAAHLAGVVRQRVGAELIVADTTERALDAIGNRVPDLVLVPALLSPQDDAALAAALRVIAAAAHVRTLTIPVLASAVAAAPRRGLLAKWRRGRAESPAPDGCDPAVFAEQIAAYLREAAAERAEQDPVADVTDVAAEAAEMCAIVEPVPPPQTPSLAEAEMAPEPLVAAALDEEDDNEEDIDLSLELIELSKEPPSDEVEELFAGEPIGVYTMPSMVEEAVLELHVEEAIVEPHSEEATVGLRVEEAIVEPLVEEAIVEPLAACGDEDGGAHAERELSDVEPWMSAYLTPGRMWPALEGVPAEPPRRLDEFAALIEAEPASPAPAAKSERPEWTELVASLRQDIERRRGEPQPEKQKRRAKKSKPVQDEWGFFDPEQCGFAALLAKLDEITDGAEDPDVRQPS